MSTKFAAHRGRNEPQESVSQRKDACLWKPAKETPKRPREGCAQQVGEKRTRVTQRGKKRGGKKSVPKGPLKPPNPRKKKRRLQKSRDKR